MGTYPFGMTRAEAVVVDALARGMRVKQIALRLQISHGAVDQRIKSAKRRAEVETSPALTAAWVRAWEFPRAYERWKNEGGMAA